MTDTAQQIASPPSHAERDAPDRSASRVWTSVFPFIVVIALWQFASLFFPRFLFPSLIDVFWRCMDIFSTGAMFWDVMATVLRILGWPWRRVHHWRLTRLDHGALEGGRQVPVADPDAVPGHSRAVLGGVRHHLVSRRRISNLLHHGDDDIARLHLPGDRRAARHVEGSHGDGVFVPADTPEAVPRDDRAGYPSGHPDGVEGQSRQRRRAWSWWPNWSALPAVSATSLLQQQQLFDMAGALAWTLQLVFFVLIVQGALTLIENTAFRYRAVSERAL